MRFPDWRHLQIHESSPSGGGSRKLRREAPGYSSTFYPDEDLEHLSFTDESFDIFVTQDVLEHVLDTASAFSEIARVLRPGGAHVFTVPYWPDRDTVVRVARSATGVIHLDDPVYHSDPGNPEGALVVRDWGRDLADSVRGACGLGTEVIDIDDRRLGLEGEMKEVFVTAKPRAEAHSGPDRPEPES
jgi:SAM-dependent methyltransferase